MRTGKSVTTSPGISGFRMFGRWGACGYPARASRWAGPSGPHDVAGPVGGCRCDAVVGAGAPHSDRRLSRVEPWGPFCPAIVASRHSSQSFAQIQYACQGVPAIESGSDLLCGGCLVEDCSATCGRRSASTIPRFFDHSSSTSCRPVVDLSEASRRHIIESSSTIVGGPSADRRPLVIYSPTNGRL